MTEHFKEPKWGFWIPVKDRQSATYAAKMSGFPVFLSGFSLLLQSNLVFPLRNGTKFSFLILGLGITICGLFFIISALKIRKHKFATLPVSVGLWLGFTTLSMLLVPHALKIMNIIIGLLCVSGLRGWWWLKQNPTTT